MPRRWRAAAASVAQNDQDLAAERGLSNFDQRHRFAGDFTYELPFGANKRWFNSGTAASLFGNWQLNGNVPLASGTPFTARVLGSIQRRRSGVNGTLRANYNGAADRRSAIRRRRSSSTRRRSRFPRPGRSATPAGTRSSARARRSMNLGLTKNITFSQTRGLSIQILGEQPVQRRPVRVDRHERQLADLRPGDVGAPDAPRAAHDEVQVLMTTKKQPQSTLSTQRSLCGFLRIVGS